MDFRLAKVEDKNEVLNIINEAKEYFKENNIDQWQNGYPNEEVILNDINNKESYVFMKDKRIIGVATISFRGEETYNNIYEGRWLSNRSYAVVHRIAVRRDLKGLGVASEIIRKAEEILIENNIHSIKVDTHEENKSMQNLLRKNGFTYCGIIYLEDKSTRVAFEKLL